MHQLLEAVALTRDMAAHGLCRGDVGAVVDVPGPGAYEVEFVAASGRTQALICVEEADIRAIGDKDLISVRSLAELEI